MTAEQGDWIVYTQNERPRPRGSLLIGGPWAHAHLQQRKIGGWIAKSGNGSNVFVVDREILTVCLSRGEAIIIVDKLTETQQEYIRERDALKPKFQARIDAILKNT